MTVQIDRGLPTGTVTILFTDIEGSTRLLQALGAPRYSELLSEHHRLMRAAVAACHGVEIKTDGDSFFVVFHAAGQRDITSLSAAIFDAASLAAMTGNLGRAATLIGAARRIVEESGGQPPPELINRVDATPALERGLDPVVLDEMLVRGRAMSNDEAAALALSD